MNALGRSLLLLTLMLPSACGKHIRPDIPYGKSFDVIEIRSVPTSAMIYIDGVKMSNTPFTIDIAYQGNEKITITAMPMYAGQNRQDIQIQTPDIPELITIDMSFKEAIDLSDIEGAKATLEREQLNSGVVEESVESYLQRQQEGSQQ
ncbi:PEGA domain-containing protein [Sinobacterium caligoides]|uniref:PEGA domain-containing protein n=1 Tax=Sinobacterium caligoides TaxID=933926 RepID=A0A3N2DNZ4_9GAMM|nr:PEGA domain-containing protein [Sinobacterium caligoides]ROS01517.1 PEGA domain-containing protein [Sinobacterium caligoides]